MSWRLGFRAIIATLAFAVMPLASPADETAAGGQKQQAQKLAREALGCLRRGEDAATSEQKLAAYRDGMGLARRAVELDEANVDAQFALFATEGRVLLSEGVVPNPINLYQSRNRLERVLELDPNYSDALAAKGGMYRQLPWTLGGDLAKAEDCLTKAIQSNPESIGARIELAATYRDMGQPERALPLLETAVRIAKQQGRRTRLQEANQLLAEIEPEVN